MDADSGAPERLKERHGNELDLKRWADKFRKNRIRRREGVEHIRNSQRC